MSWAQFGHTREKLSQAFSNQREIWWAVRDSNPLAPSIFSKLLILLITQMTEIDEITTRGHNLGTRAV